MLKENKIIIFKILFVLREKLIYHVNSEDK